MAGAEDSIEQPRQNLLTVVLDRLHQQGKETIISRMMYFTALKHNVNSKEEMKAYHEARKEAARGPVPPRGAPAGVVAGKQGKRGWTL